jgi:hypothetical protein
MFLALFSGVAHAQAVWQPAAAPPVTAETASWYLSGEPVTWNGDLYYPAGAVQFFNPYQMVRSGSFKGIPLYTDATLEPNSMVFVPLSGERMRPYERPRTGALAGTMGSTAPSFPTPTSTLASPPAGLNQAPSAPTQISPSELSPSPVPELAMLRPTDTSAVAQPAPVGTSGRSPAPAAATRSMMTTLRRPTGVNNIWINFDGRRWLLAGKAIEYQAEGLTEIGTYHGWSVYTRNGDRSIIYLPSTPGYLAPYKKSAVGSKQ